MIWISTGSGAESKKSLSVPESGKHHLTLEKPHIQKAVPSLVWQMINFS